MILRRFEIVLWCLDWSENAALFKRLMKIYSNPTILYYSFKVIICIWSISCKIWFRLYAGEFLHVRNFIYHDIYVVSWNSVTVYKWFWQRKNKHGKSDIYTRVLSLSHVYFPPVKWIWWSKWGGGGMTFSYSILKSYLVSLHAKNNLNFSGCLCRNGPLQVAVWSLTNFAAVLHVHQLSLWFSCDFVI